jgi:ABC-type transport system involved in multi-copper enzyme maturation permease subunit
VIPEAFLRQFLAEFFKARRRSLYYGALAVLLFFSVLPLAVAFAAWRSPNLRDWALDFVSYPGGLWLMLKNVQLILPMLVVVVAAGTVGGEYSAGTWKMTLPRTASRTSVMVAKFVASAMLSMGALWVAMAVSIGASALGARLLGVPFFSTSAGVGGGEFLRSQAFLLLQLVLVISYGMLAAVLTRSLIGGMLLGVVMPHLLRFGTFLPFGWLSPMTNLDLLQARWLPQSRFRAVDVESALGRSISWQTSTGTVLLFSLGFTLLAVWLFERRDLASE